jgi:hypothetical protein
MDLSQEEENQHPNKIIQQHSSNQKYWWAGVGLRFSRHSPNW